jgi:hypothetical protein
MGVLFCFNSQFFGLETSRRAVVSELNVWDVVSLKAGENCESKQTVCFDSKPILLWLQLYAEVTEYLSFVRYCQS